MFCEAICLIIYALPDHLFENLCPIYLRISLLDPYLRIHVIWDHVRQTRAPAGVRAIFAPTGNGGGSYLLPFNN